MCGASGSIHCFSYPFHFLILIPCWIMFAFIMMLHSEAKVELEDVRRVFQEASQPRGMFIFDIICCSCLHMRSQAWTTFAKAHSYFRYFAPLVLICNCCSIPPPSYFALQDEHAANLKLEQEREAEAEAQRQKQVHLETNLLLFCFLFCSINYVYKLMYSHSERTT